MRLDDGAVDAVLLMRADNRRQLKKNCFLQTFVRPAVKTIVDRLGGTVVRRDNPASASPLAAHE